MAVRIGIIGTAGRREDGSRLTLELYKAMFHDSLRRIKERAQREEIILVSGGAAGADQLVISHYLAGNAEELWLFLPAPFEKGRYVENGFRSPGSIANYYHKKFSVIMGGDTLDGITKSIKKGAKIYVNKGGFLARNKQVARSVDYLIAYTFGSGDEPADGGTSHTWRHCEVSKEHVPLEQFE